MKKKDDIDFGYHIANTSLEWLEPMLNGWNDAIVAYCTAHKDGDVPYYYNERTSISLLAAGAWLKDLIALEEYVAKKRSSKDSTYSGRSDLYVTHKEKNQYAVFEAKQAWLHPDDPDAIITGGIKDAVKDAQKNREIKQKVGVCFYGVYAKDALGDLALDQLIERLKATSWNGGKKFCALAWSFPKITRTFQEISRVDKKKYYYPGIIVGLSTTR